MREFLEGRRFGFALRAPLANVAVGLGIAVTLLDLMSWFGWGSRETNGFVVASYWLSAGTAIVALLALATALAEMRDIRGEEHNLARLDVIGVAVAALLYVGSGVARSIDLGATAASPLALLLELAGLVILLVGSAMASVLYAGREWEEIEEVAHERHRRRRAAGR